MPYKDKQKQAEYQAEWMAARRDAWFAKNGPCCRCGSTVNLQADHKDRATKVDHRVWSWSEARREAELAKCQVLCASCHNQKTRADNGDVLTHGTRSMYTSRVVTTNGKRGCRCDLCREANRIYIQERRAVTQ